MPVQATCGTTWGRTLGKLALSKVEEPGGAKAPQLRYSTSNSIVRTFEVLPAESIAFNSARYAPDGNLSTGILKPSGITGLPAFAEVCRSISPELSTFFSPLFRSVTA